ncbi:energy-coupling factor transporter ATPase domain containing protein [Rhizobium phage B1VFA]|nr:energy-coupling factor transporter ATPase domain containing protein [Rhizobium phage B1VFA]
MHHIPKNIALCGHPGSGKSTAADIINEVYGHELADDGLPLRKIGMDYLGLTAEQVFTQEGKKQKVMLNGREWEVREILGEIGNAFEEKFGGDIIPIMSHNARPEGSYSVFGSVRREQGLYWRNHGALVLEIVNPLAGPSQYEFDRFNPEFCHARINNDGLARGLEPAAARQDLLEKLVAVIGRVH